MTWEIHLLGVLKANAPDGQTTVWSGTRAGLLLAFLCLQPDRPHLRETLAESLWPDGDPATKRVRLRQEIAALRQVFDRTGETGPLFVTRTDVMLRSTGVTIDLQQFDRAVAVSAVLTDPSEREAALQEAADVYDGDLLIAYPDHFVSQRTHYSQVFHKVLRDLAALQRERADYAGAINTLNRLVTRDPIHEEAHAELMRLYAAMDEPSLVRRQYQELARLLKAELSEGPSESIQALYRALRKNAADSITLDPLPPKPETLNEASVEPIRPDPGMVGANPAALVTTTPESSTLPEPPPGKETGGQKSPGSSSSKKTIWSGHLLGLPKVTILLPVLASLALTVFSTLRPAERAIPDTNSTPPPLAKYTPTSDVTDKEWVYFYQPAAGELPNAEGRAIRAISKGRFVATGFIHTEKDNTDFLTVFLDHTGTAYATDRYGTPEHDCDRAFSVAADLQGGVFVAGESYIPGPPHIDGWYLTLVKYSEDGERLWVQRSPVRTIPSERKIRVVTDGYGGAYIAGTAIEGDIRKILLLRYDTNGKLLFMQTLPAGNGKNTVLEDLRLMENATQGVVLCGVAQIGEVENDLDSDWVVARFSPAGKQEWVRLVDGGENKHDAPAAILQNRFGHIYVGGTFTTTEGVQMALARFSEEGEVYWKRTSTASGPEANLKTLGMEHFRGDFIYLAGEKRMPDQQVSAFIACFSPSGYLKWERPYSNLPDYATLRANAVAVTPAGNLFVSGEISSLLPNVQGWRANLWTGSFGPDGRWMTQQMLSDSPTVPTQHKFGDMCATLEDVLIVGQSAYSMSDARFMVVRYDALP